MAVLGPCPGPRGQGSGVRPGQQLNSFVLFLRMIPKLQVRLVFIVSVEEIAGGSVGIEFLQFSPRQLSDCPSWPVTPTCLKRC